jgi:hypothetical protein
MDEVRLCLSVRPRARAHRCHQKKLRPQLLREWEEQFRTREGEYFF